VPFPRRPIEEGKITGLITRHNTVGNVVQRGLDELVLAQQRLFGLIAQLRLHGVAEALDAEIERAEREAIAAPELLWRLLR